MQIGALMLTYCQLLTTGSSYCFCTLRQLGLVLRGLGGRQLATFGATDKAVFPDLYRGFGTYYYRGHYPGHIPIVLVSDPTTLYDLRTV